MSPSEYLDLITQKYLLLDLISKIKSPKSRKEKQEQLDSINEKIAEYELKVYGTKIHSL